MMSSAGSLLSEFKRTNSANRTLSRVLMPRRPDSGGSMRLADVAPKEHERQHHISPGGTQTNRPCQHGGDHREFHVFPICSRRGHLRIALPSELWSTECKSPAIVPRHGTRLAVDHCEQRSRPVWGLQHQSCPATGDSGLQIRLNSETMSTRLRAGRNRVLFRYGSWECARAYDSG
jgi:hypothetical protein